MKTMHLYCGYTAYTHNMCPTPQFKLYVSVDGREVAVKDSTVRQHLTDAYRLDEVVVKVKLPNKFAPNCQREISKNIY